MFRGMNVRQIVMDCICIALCVLTVAAVLILYKRLPDQLPQNFNASGEVTRYGNKSVIFLLLGVLVLIESSDIMFAIDSVPAVLSVSRDLFIVYTSNIFAILGLRQLFFVIEHMQERFAYVRYGVAVILIFTGLKMVAGIIDLHISTPVSIAVIIGTLVISIAASMIVSKKKA